MNAASVMAVPPSSSHMDDYEIIQKCGEGTYGAVYKAMSKKDRSVVALKKVVNVPKEDGTPVEVKYLKALNSSKNIVHLTDSFWSKEGELCMVFEFMAYDLWRLSTSPNISFNMVQIKCIVQQMLEGLHQCHSAGIMHRDVKPSNLLINDEGTLKLADFGLTTSFLTGNYLSNNVVSLYYRSPELLMGSHAYGPEIDMWSVGCIMIELITNNYLFAGANDNEQLDLIFRVFGTPTEETWPGVSQLPGFTQVKGKRRHPSRLLSDMFSFLTPDALDLVSKLMALDPKKRISSWEALQHPWFWTSPLPCPPSFLFSHLNANWSLGGTRTGPYRKYQSDFARSKKLHATDNTRRRNTSNNAGSTRRRGGGGGGSSSSSSARGRGPTYNAGRQHRTTHYSPYQCRRNGYNAQNPIVIAS